MSKDFIITMGLIAIGVTALVVVTSNPKPHGSHTREGGTERSMEDLENAVKGFESVYSKLPELGVAETTTDSAEGRRLLAILLSSADDSAVSENPRQIRFLSAMEKKGRNRGGLVSQGAGSPPALYDAWGEPFRIFLRKSPSDPLSFTWQGQSVVLHEAVLAIVSKGPDKVEGSADDLRSW